MVPAVYQWCDFKSRRGKNKHLTALKSNSNTVWFNFQTYIIIYIYISNKNIPVDIYFSVHDMYHQLHSKSKGWKAKSQYSYCSIYSTNVKTMPTCKLIDFFAPSDFVSIFLLINICFYLFLLSIFTNCLLIKKMI
jgi:hypothetical protein